MFLNSKNISLVVQMSDNNLKRSRVDMHTEFVFDKGMIGVKNLSIIRLILFFLLWDDFPDQFLRFTFPLDKSEDAVNVIKNDASFVNEVYLFSLFFLEIISTFFFWSKLHFGIAIFYSCLIFGDSYPSKTSEEFCSTLSFVELIPV